MIKKDTNKIQKVASSTITSPISFIRLPEPASIKEFMSTFAFSMVQIYMLRFPFLRLSGGIRPFF
jgi:hypothetical protein